MCQVRKATLYSAGLLHFVLFVLVGSRFGLHRSLKRRHVNKTITEGGDEACFYVHDQCVCIEFEEPDRLYCVIARCLPHQPLPKALQPSLEPM